MLTVRHTQTKSLFHAPFVTNGSDVAHISRGTSALIQGRSLMFVTFVVEDFLRMVI
jgi:S-adenosylhomocysteine hydrolase